jgi:hypothetical protein
MPSLVQLDLAGVNVRVHPGAELASVAALSSLAGKAGDSLGAPVAQLPAGRHAAGSRRMSDAWAGRQHVMRRTQAAQGQASAQTACRASLLESHAR